MTDAGLGALARMALPWCGLLLWRWMAERLACMPSAILLVLVAATLALSATEVAFYRRHAFLSHYLNRGGRLFRLLSGKGLIVLWQAVKALLLGLILLISALDFDLLEWLVLLADVLLMAALTASFSTVLRPEIRPPYCGPVARNWALRVNAVLLWGVWLVVQLFSAHENYTGLRWEDVAAFGAYQASAGCDVLGVLARASAVGEALALWAGQNLIGSLDRPGQVLMAWLVFAGSVGVSFVVAWAYSRALAGAVSRPWLIWRRIQAGA